MGDGLPANGHSKRIFKPGKDDEEARIELVDARQTSSTQHDDGDGQSQNPSVLRDALAKRCCQARGSQTSIAKAYMHVVLLISHL